MERKDNADYVKSYAGLVVEGKGPVGRLKKTWQNTLSADMRLLKVDCRNIHDLNKRRAIRQRKVNPAKSGTLP